VLKWIFESYQGAVPASLVVTGHIVMAPLRPAHLANLGPDRYRVVGR